MWNDHAKSIINDEQQKQQKEKTIFPFEQLE